MNNKPVLFLIAIAGIVGLEIYSNYFSQNLLPQDGPTTDQLIENSSFYEGKKITLLYMLVKRHEGNHLIVSEPASRNQVVVPLTKQMRSQVKQGDIVAITGISRMDSQYVFQAESIHVYQSWWWRPLVSLAGLLLTVFLIWKEKLWRTGNKIPRG